VQANHWMRLCLMALTLPVCSAVLAADQTYEVKFGPGARSATLAGTAKGYDVVAYVLGAKARQVLSVSFDADNRGCVFYFYNHDATEPKHEGSVVNNKFESTLPADGNYSVKVMLYRAQAREGQSCNFSITFRIS
jgi:hypothetical protein